MARVKRGVQAKARHKKVLKQAKGFRGARSRTYKVAKQAVMRAGQYAYRDRRVKKRVFRSLWIVRINAAARDNGLTYSQLITGLKKANIVMYLTLGRMVILPSLILWYLIFYLDSSFAFVFWGLLVINWLFGIFVFLLTKYLIKKEQKRMQVV